MLLAIDTSTRSIGIALYDGNRVLCEHTWISKNHHTIELAPSIDQALVHVGAESGDLQAVGVAIGPGSFTGLRIGLAFAKGLVISQRISIIGIPTLNVLAETLPVHSSSRLAAVLEAGRRRLAVGWYRAKDGAWSSDGDLQNLAIEEFVGMITSPIYVIGELTGETRLRLQKTKGIISSPVNCARRPAVLAELAWNRWRKNDVDDPGNLKPIYLHYGDPIPG
jgi:tRNA threonylcarbamoyladenosine biosynthesis protein TsaB